MKITVEAKDQTIVLEDKKLLWRYQCLHGVEPTICGTKIIQGVTFTRMTALEIICPNCDERMEFNKEAIEPVLVGDRLHVISSRNHKFEEFECVAVGIPPKRP